ncbi:MAG TPA: hypothetical protein VMW15_04445 [Terracidiphilus sp.]|nr:hypothetical protein [Terracidiphilus sp.]
MPGNHCSSGGTAFNEGLPFLLGSSSITIYAGASSAPDTPSSAFSPAPPIHAGRPAVT